MSNVENVDVVIAGMGPVGMMAGLMLSRKGHTVLIADKKPKPYTLPRAVAHDGEIARILQNVGLLPDQMPEAIEPYDDMYVWVNANDEILLEVDWTGIDQSGWNNEFFYNQPNLEKYIDAKMRSNKSLEAVRGASVNFVAQDASGVDVQLVDEATGAVRNVRAKYLLGADGANSETRQAVGLSWNDLGFFYDWLVVDVIPGPDAKITHLAKQIADPARPTTVVPAGPGRRRWEFMLLEGETSEEITKPERIWELLERFDVTPANAEIERGVVYRFKSGWADEWRQGRVFLLGDAAHTTPPFAGQGLCAGVRDAVNLSWKLDLVLNGLAEASLLETYSNERLHHAEGFIYFAMELGKIICITDPEQAAARDAAMKAELESGRKPEPPPAPRLGEGLHVGDEGGHLSWQGKVTTKTHSTPIRFDDIFGAGALILANGSLVDEVSPEDIKRLKAAGIAVVTFGENSNALVDEFVDVEGTYGNWFASEGHAAVFVRPDFYIYGVGKSAADVASMVSSFTSKAALV